MRRTLVLPINDTPHNLNEQTFPTNSITVIGANGSGKTRFGALIEERNRDVHRITAQKSLVMPDEVSTKSIDTARKEFTFGGYNDNQSEEWNATVGKKSYRYNGKPSTHLLSDYFNLMTLLFSEEFETSVSFRTHYQMYGVPTEARSKLDDVISIWENLLPHRKINKSSGRITVTSNNLYSSPYKGSEMSDGERVIFYLIGEVLCTKIDSIVIIDEPELHIHKALIKNLFDEIERKRPDILFVYLTHDIDFAVSRNELTKIWLKSYIQNHHWQFEILGKDSYMPDSIYLEILGSRKPILFIEGEKSSPDYQVYSILFPNYTVTPISSCTKVIESTKAFNDAKGFHHLDAQGIIDRDRRDDNEVSEVEKNNIKVLKVSEVENLFLLEDVVKTVATRMGQNCDEVFAKVKKNVITAFAQELEKQVTEYTIYFFKRQVANSIDSAKNWSELEEGMKNSFHVDHYHSLYEEFFKKFSEYIDNQDYNAILKFANLKKLLSRSDIAKLCLLQNSADAVRSFIIHIVKTGGEEGSVISNAMISMVF